MRIHPNLQDPDAVLVLHTPLAEPFRWEDFQRAAGWAMDVMQIELEGERAVIKPNITSGERFSEPDTGITTHPGFVQGMVEYLQKHGARARQVTIAEDPRNTDNNARRSWEKTCYQRVAQATGAKLHFPSTYTCVKKSVPRPLARQVLNVSRLATAPNTALFNVPKLKNHNLAITTLSMKNLMGLVSVFDRHFCLQSWQELPPAVQAEQRPRHEWFTSSMHEQWQTGLARRLVDTAQVIHPALNIVEGIVGREGTGFQRGRNRALGLVVAGVNLVAVDSLASYLMGSDPQDILYLRLAAEAGLGKIDIDQLHIYTEQEGELMTCPDVHRLRIDPPFRVIKNIQGEDPDPFDSAGSGIMDSSDMFFGKSRA